MKLFLLILALICSGCSAGAVVQDAREDNFNYTLIFCGDCMSSLLTIIENSDEIACALYNADEKVIRALEEKNADVVMNWRSKIESRIVSKRKAKGLMHNKFCVFDRRTVWTGSWNPLSRKTRDDVIIIDSRFLAENYLEEFEELKGNASKRTAAKRAILNQSLVENYFCPEDECIRALQARISSANETVHFAAYSFTHPRIANELIIKSNQGVTVRGIIEKGSKYSQITTLKNNDLDVVEDPEGSVMHHKFFIIDGKTVITGSFNPTRNGDTRNDENFLVIHDRDVASGYLERFNELRG